MQWILNGDIGGAYTMVVAYARYKNIMTMVTKKWRWKWWRSAVKMTTVVEWISC